jgi:hypothetical protein
MNDMDADENAQYSAAIENSQIQFPLSAYALKRQVFFMNFVDFDDLSMGRLFILYLTNFHPLFTFKFRYDPNISR